MPGESIESVKAWWEEFDREVLPPQVPPEIRKIVQIGFYSGFAVCLTELVPRRSNKFHHFFKEVVEYQRGLPQG